MTRVMTLPMHLLLLLPPNAHAGLVTAIDAPVALPLGGGWARAFPTDTGWDFLWAAGGEYNLLPMSPQLDVVDSGRTQLTGRADLVDHGITRCPDGTYLHASSANLDEFNDSAFAFRYDAAWARTASGTLAEREPGREHNDLLVICSPLLDATLFVEGGPNNPVLVEIGEDGAPAGETRLDTRTNLMGGSMVWDPDTDTLVSVGFNNTQSILVERWDADLTKLETIEVAAVPAPQRVYWTQATLRAGDHWLVAHMARDDSAGWAADEGNVWLQVFDLDWNLLESHPVTDFAPPAGGMRPGLARKDGELLVLFDKGVQPHVVRVTLDSASLGEDPSTDTGGEAGDDASAGCGCGTTEPGVRGAGVWGLALLAGLTRRRRAAR